MDNTFTCGICRNTHQERAELTGCNHPFCIACLSRWVIQGHNTCPICRTTGRLAYVVDGGHSVIQTEDIDVHIISPDEDGDENNEEEDQDIPLHPVIQSQSIMDTVGELLNVSVDTVHYTNGVPSSMEVSIDTPFPMKTTVSFEPDTVNLFRLMRKYRRAKRKRVSLQIALGEAEEEEQVASQDFKRVFRSNS